MNKKNKQGRLGVEKNVTQTHFTAAGTNVQSYPWRTFITAVLICSFSGLDWLFFTLGRTVLITSFSIALPFDASIIYDKLDFLLKRLNVLSSTRKYLSTHFEDENFHGKWSWKSSQEKTFIIINLTSFPSLSQCDSTFIYFRSVPMMWKFLIKLNSIWATQSEVAETWKIHLSEFSELLAFAAATSEM